MPQITEVTPKDLPDLLRMIRKLCAYHGDPCHMGLADCQARFIAGPLIGLIARQGGQAIGYAALETHWRPMHNGDLIDVAHLFVEDPWRGRGVGKALLRAAQDRAQAAGASRLVIGSAPDNAAAAAAYRAMGFAEITAMPGPRFNIPLPP